MLLLAALVTALTACATTLLALRLGAPMRGAIIAGLGLLFGTVAFVYGRELFAEPLLSLLTVTAIYFALDEERRGHPALEFLCAGLAVLAKPTGIILGPCLSLYALVKRRPFFPKVCWPTLGTFCGLALYGVYNYWRFGSPFDFGQAGAFSLGGVPIAVAGLLVSPGRGLLWYCPAVVAVVLLPRPLFRRIDVALIAMVAAAYLLIYSTWSDWPGGWCWGPRFLVPALPGLMATTGVLSGRRLKALVLLIVIGFIVNSPNLACYYERYYQEANAAGISDYSRVWTVRDAPIVRIWPTLIEELAVAKHTGSDVRQLVRMADPNTGHDLAHAPTLRIVPIWWWMLPVVGIARALGALVMALMLVAAGALLGRALILNKA